MDLQTLLKKSETKLNEINPTLKAKAIQLIEKAYSEGIWILVTQGLRTIAEQNALYAQGRTTSGKIVTNAKGGTSYHNFGLAFDFAVYNSDGKTINWTIDSRWKRVGAIGKSLGLEWGGDFKSIKDVPHFQLTFGLTTAQLRAGAKPPTSTPSTTSNPTGSSGVIQMGDNNNNVVALQQKLNAVGYNLTADGDFGKATYDAVASFQKKYGLTADGVAGQATLKKLNAVLDSAKTETESKIDTKTDKGDDEPMELAQWQKTTIIEGVKKYNKVIVDGEPVINSPQTWIDKVNKGTLTAGELATLTFAIVSRTQN